MPIHRPTRQGGGGLGAAAPDDFQVVIFGQKHLIFGQETITIRAKPLDFRATSFPPKKNTQTNKQTNKRLLRVLHEYRHLCLTVVMVVIGGLLCTRLKKVHE